MLWPWCLREYGLGVCVKVIFGVHHSDTTWHASWRERCQGWYYRYQPVIIADIEGLCNAGCKTRLVLLAPGTGDDACYGIGSEGHHLDNLPHCLRMVQAWPYGLWAKCATYQQRSFLRFRAYFLDVDGVGWMQKHVFYK